MYSALVLDEKSRALLLASVSGRVPSCHSDVIAHHMTICMGPLPQHLSKYLGTTQYMLATHFAMNDKVCAVLVATEVHTKNQFPHVTIAVNRDAGGKPKDSNTFKSGDWLPISEIVLFGVVQEVSS